MKINNVIDSVITILDRLQNIQHNTERRIAFEIKKAKRKFIFFFSQIMLILFGMLLLVTGIILFLTRFFQADLVIIIFGCVLLYVALMMHVFKK